MVKKNVRGKKAVGPPQPKLKKDPGLPNLRTVKQKLTNQLERHKKDIEAQKNRQQEARRRLSNQNRSLTALVRNAEKRDAQFNASQGNGAEENYAQVAEAALSSKDNSRRAYYKEFRKVMEAADVILEVLDARDPIGCRTKQIERLIMESGTNKRIILILNKIDLVPREVVEQWLKFLRNEYPTVAFKASTQNQRKNLGQSNISVDTASEDLLNTSECLGADNLIKLLKNYCRNSNLKTSITVGVIGFPNVGKSSVINSLRRSKVCGVGSTPGFTKVAQEIHLDKNIKLLDCPGIVFSKGDNGESLSEVLLRNCIKVELLEDPVTPVEFIVEKCNPEQLMSLYSVEPFANANDFLIQLAKQRGKLKRGGIPDIASAARSILNDWNIGKIPFYTVPPTTRRNEADTAIVQGWSKEFSLDELDEDQSILAGVAPMVEFSAKPIVMTAEEQDNIDEAMNSDSDEMEEDDLSHMDMKPQIQINPKIKNKPIVRTSKVQDLITEAEAELNPQMNKSLKKQMKQQRKKAQKAVARSGEDMEMEMEDGAPPPAFDFGSYAGGLPGDDEDEEEL
ncbi:P-loop containing nucleoside triphosphate hydrolase protein [Basidiobolus meristosporus CBS 931.73]|uniref:p-loop containing nucleoside triphosphate hydrolase protein n=1 Tax=Basidiobolus meristosporus CBS 931.73 TaxID=1314790 RepID=A0A1Y1YHJ2_9FUNG|nr:P-loop containing nucleoside triphosphate hydrolase protein [Basidiobolus meristosporus CBS 931.73]|eukprot:ORX97084.1 P-loop containing nucleoside triphosphate hydrolase protein [Basidiobolus meristosporus CBS 931.73]